MKYEVTRYFSSFIAYEIEAESEEDAYNKTKDIRIDLIELQNNLQEWEEADEITKLEESN